MRKTTSSPHDHEARSFELRFFSSDPQANGETDFKGETSVLSTPDRIRYLETYADVACRFFDDSELDRLAVPPPRLKEALSRLKPQPLPAVRRRISLTEWRWQAIPPQSGKQPRPPLPTGIIQQNNRLEWQTSADYVISFPPQAWRAFFWFSLTLPDDEKTHVIDIGDIAILKLKRHSPIHVHGKPFGAALLPGTRLDIKVEADCVSDGGRFNLLVNGNKVVDWEPMRTSTSCDAVKIAGTPGLRLFNARGLGFDPTPSPNHPPHPDQPYCFHPLFNLDFHDVTPMDGWEQPGFKDTVWRRTHLPRLHGGCLEAGEDIALRSQIKLPAFVKATLRFDDWQNEGADWFTRVVDTIAGVDPSRLISPTANFDQIHAPSDDGTLDRNNQPVVPPPAWRHPLTVRGNMETPTGYAQEWSVLRTWPRPPEWSGEQGWIRTGFREQYLSSDHHAYFDFESEESAAQPNWPLHRGQPYYRLRSYEIGYDKGSIGRETTCDEWRISQAWQAFSAYEAYRKKRLLDYDGMAWCTLDGGGNSGTYEKPLTDTLGHMKLAFHALRMAFQPVLAGSRDVDIVYGPDDAILPVVLNLGPERRVEVTVRIGTPEGQPVAEKTYPNVRLPAGRTRVDLAPWPRPNLEDGIYVVHYEVKPNGA